MKVEHLEDAARGTLTPAVTGSGTAGAPSGVSRQVGTWERIGRLVVCSYHIQFTGHTGSGDMLIQLPFNTANADGLEWSVQNLPVGFNGSAYDAATIYLLGDEAKIKLAGYYPFLQVQNITSEFNIQGIFKFFTDDAI